ncbi:hypothetical protein [Dendronalium sp. ChiSLP03b]|uniref:hypothetical protein n=1 Tax=Dendronalium sp. ChiSLP03b TaxID=3075381 RepID=UPI002AD4EEF1|nr:hypothetical protein [Dendronalium sp. ChiSLP03b]MDZ8203406.1 hypothetical protein [Dendronalium sp. ChiSLP03b]
MYFTLRVTLENSRFAVLTAVDRGEPVRWAALQTCRRALRGFPQGSNWRGNPQDCAASPTLNPLYYI